MILGCQKKEESNPVQQSNKTPPETKTVIEIEVPRTYIDFGNTHITPSGKTGGIGITNSNASNAELTGTVTVTGEYFFLDAGGPSFRIAPNSTASISVRFTPKKVGYAAGTLSIEHNSPSKNSPISVALSGFGVQ